MNTLRSHSKRFFAVALASALGAAALGSSEAKATTYNNHTSPGVACVADYASPAVQVTDGAVVNNHSGYGLVYCPLYTNGQGTNGVQVYAWNNYSGDSVGAAVCNISGSGTVSCGTSATSGSAGSLTLSPTMTDYSPNEFNFLEISMPGTYESSNVAVYGYNIGLAAE